jgi:hypothetical protein
MLNNADPAKVMNAMWEDLMSASFLFYAIAAYEGYKFSAFRRSDIASAPDASSQQKPAEVVRADQVDAQEGR